MLLLAVTALIALLMPIVILVLISSFTELSHPEYVQKLSGLDISGSTIVSVEDTHGGFHGDGDLVVIFDCAEIAESVAAQMTEWKPLPMTASLQNLLYGGGIQTGIAEQVGIPEVTNGFYFFWDRHSESQDPTDESKLNDRHSWNFTVLLYDAENVLLYLFELDT